MPSKFQLTLEQVAGIRAMLGDADPDLVHDSLEGETDVYEIMDYLLGKLAEEESSAQVINGRVLALNARKAACEARAESLRGALHACMTATGEKSLRRPEATLTVRPLKPSILQVDEAALPDKFFKVTRAVSRSLINAALADGEAVPGVVLSNGGECLSIRR